MSNGQQQLAEQVAQAMASQGDTKALQEQLLAALGNLDESVVFDVGAGNRMLLVRKGWTPIKDPAEFIEPVSRL